MRYVVGECHNGRFYPRWKYNRAVPAVARYVWANLTRTRSELKLGIRYELREA